MLEKDEGDSLNLLCEKIEILHEIMEKGNIVHAVQEGRLAALVTSCVRTAF
jgi:hypothetical protein